jgi:hypothetical protein
MKFISKNALNIVLGILSAVTVFHFCIIFKVIPYDITWGGRLKNDAEMYVFEALSIQINLFLMWVLSMQGGYTKYKFSGKAINIFLWIFIVIYSLNTIGNIFAKTNFERIFTGLTLLLAILIWLIVKKKH